MKYLILLFLVATSACSAGGAGAGTNSAASTASPASYQWPKTVTGWTDLATIYSQHQSQIQIIYVSSSVGADSNSGTDPSQPVKTFTQAQILMTAASKSGLVPWIEFKGGDTFDSDTEAKDVNFYNPPGGLPANSNPTAANDIIPAVYTSYAQVYDQNNHEIKPLIIGQLLSYNSNGDTTTNFHHVAVIGLHLSGAGQSSYYSTAIGTAAFIDDLLIEDCYIEKYVDDLTFQGYPVGFPPYPAGTVIQGQASNVDVRRSQLVDAACNPAPGETAIQCWDDNVDYNGQGIYATGVKGFVIEENFFDHNGWLDVDPNHPNGPNMTRSGDARHDLYIKQSDTDVVLWGNIFAQGTDNVQLRGGGDAICNLFVQDASGIDYWYENGNVIANVFLEGVDTFFYPDYGGFSAIGINSDALALSDTTSGQALNINANLFARSVDEYNNTNSDGSIQHHPAINLVTGTGVTLTNNVIFDWGSIGTIQIWNNVGEAANQASYNITSGYPTSLVTLPNEQNDTPVKSLLGVYLTQILSTPSTFADFVSAERIQSRNSGWDTRLTACPIDMFMRQNFGMPEPSLPAEPLPSLPSTQN